MTLDIFSSIEINNGEGLFEILSELKWLIARF